MNPAPSKVIAFSGQLFHDRLPTRNNLDLRGILGSNDPWECRGWLGLVIEIPHSQFSLFEVIKGSARNVKVRHGFMMIWHSTLWSIWKARNNRIFVDGSFSPLIIVDEIKVLSWKWSLARLKFTPSMFYEWTWDPGACLLR
ncbi:hypothetical protein TSUD_154970 [Trifolium subterraneum]|uniref:Reverse transcriptase zinc-binding domain-containing protein n=1 Tax=Trifolium subterraneum TaxID=3900 RepID=A0A2Z6M4F3_TRISU|nr:hypothetical protein TSUD_154970 [Trifolium subterraneum]